MTTKQEEIEAILRQIEENKEKLQSKTFICSICEEYFCGYGNNARPVKEKKCCDRCNQLVVIYSYCHCDIDVSITSTRC